MNTLIFLPLITPFTHLIEKLLPDKDDKISFKPLYINNNMLETPSIAVMLAEKEVIRMGEVAQKNMHMAVESLVSYDESKVKYVLEHEPIVDKLNEEITRTTVKKAVELYAEREPRGEYVLILSGKPENEEEDYPEDVAEHVAMLENAGLSRMDAIKAAAKARGVKKNEVYAALIEKSEE